MRWLQAPQVVNPAKARGREHKHGRDDADQQRHAQRLGDDEDFAYADVCHDGASEREGRTRTAALPACAAPRAN